MSVLFLLKIVHDQGNLELDDLGSVEALDMLFELQKLGYIDEEPNPDCDPPVSSYVLSELGAYRLTLPDHNAEEWEKLSTPAQQVTVGRMLGLQWRVSHLWEYEDDVYAVWLIAPNMLGDGYTQAYVLGDGMMIRYENKISIPGKKK